MPCPLPTALGGIPIRRALWVPLLFLCSLAAHAGSLALLPGRGDPHDLPISGLLEGAPAGTPLHVARAALLALPRTDVDVTGEFGPKAKMATVILLEDLLKALPLSPGADLVLADCKDGYMGVYPLDFIRRYHPFLILQLDGIGPEGWPPPGLQYDPGPYVAYVSEHLAPGVGAFRDVEHKKPWGVIALRVTSRAAAFGAFSRDRWADASAPVAAGREIWIHSCASCHPGPDGVAGGTKSGLPFAVPVAVAGSNARFFMQYVRSPTSLVPTAKMEAHPHYTDAELGQLIAFLTVGLPPP
jgi:cytochrome c2